MNPLRPGPKLSDFPTLLRASPAMFRDLMHRRYRKTPVGTLVGAILGLVYLFNPMDVVPDVLPVLGLVDDSLVFGLFLTLLSRDVKQYLLWKRSSSPAPTAKQPTPPANH